MALDSQGTAEGVTFGHVGTPDPGRAGGFGTGPHVVPGHSYLIGGIYSAGGALSWIKELLGIETFDTLRAQAAGVESGTSPLFIPHFYGASPPFNRPEATGAFLEVIPEHAPAHFARAVLEGVAFEVRRVIECFETLVGKPTETVRIVGGSAGDELWSGIRAAVLGRPLELARHDDMVTLGAALVAGLGANLYGSPEEAVEHTFQPRRTFPFDEHQRDAYQKRYEVYERIVQKLS